MRQSFSFSKFLTATAFVGVGILLLLINLEVISMSLRDLYPFIIPMLFILFGIKWMAELLFNKRRKSILLSLAFLLIGTLMLLDELAIILFDFSTILKLWPLIFIYIGMKIILGTKKRKKYYGKHKHKHKHESKVKLNLDGAIGSVEFKDANWQVEPMDSWKAVGDYTFDFSNAFIPEKETEIKLSGWVGDIDIRLPEEIEFSVDAHASVGDLKVCGITEDGILKDYCYKTAHFDQAEKRIKFILDFKVLDLRIDQV